MASKSAASGSPRRALLAKAHLGQKMMGLDAGEWRVFLRDVTGRDSCRDLDDAALERLLAVMRSRGIRFAPPARAGARPKSLDSTSARAPQLRKIEALLADSQLPWAYAHAIAQRMFHKDRVQLCDKDEMTAVITALNKRKAAVGRISEAHPPEPAAPPADAASALSALPTKH